MNQLMPYDLLNSEQTSRVNTNIRRLKRYAMETYLEEQKFNVVKFMEDGNSGPKCLAIAMYGD